MVGTTVVFRVPPPEDAPFEPSDAHVDDRALTSDRDGLTRRAIVGGGLALGAAALLPVGTAHAAGGARSGVTTILVPRSRLRPGVATAPIAAPRRFDLLGAAVRELQGTGVRVRTRPTGGSWSAWHPLAPHDGHAPDGRRARMSDPVWFGDADELQLTVRRRPSRDIRIDLVSVAPDTKRRTARASSRVSRTGGSAVPDGTSSPASVGGLPTIIPRAAWSAPKPKNAPSMGHVQVAFVHHTVNGNGYTQDQSAAIVRAIADYHMRSNGWSDVGYNFLVDRYGQIFEGRMGGIDQPVVGAQAVGWNSISTGIAIIGTFENEPVPDAALNAVAALIAWKLPLHGAPTAGTVPLVSSGGAGNRWARGAAVDMPRIGGHRDGCSTSCPGTTLYGQLDTIRARVGDVPALTDPRSLSVTVPETPVAYGESLEVGGRFTDAGAAVAGAVVTLQKRSPSGRWVSLARATTDAEGTWTTSIRWKASAAIRAQGGGVTSPQLTPGLDPGLALDQPTRRIKARSSVTVRGKAKGVSHVDVALRRKIGNRYVLVSRRRLAVRKGAFSGKLPVRKAGMHHVTAEVTIAKRKWASPRRYLRGVA